MDPFANNWEIADQCAQSRGRACRQCRPPAKQRADARNLCRANLGRRGELYVHGAGRNSPFTTALLQHMPSPVLEIRAVMKRVRVDVIKSTNGEQMRFDESSLTTDVVLTQ